MQTTGCLPRYSPSIAHTAQTEGRCLWHLHLPDLFYSSQFKLTYCSHLLRENEKKENLKAWSVSTDGRQVSPEKNAQSHSFPGLKSSTSPQMLSHLLAVRDEEAHRRHRIGHGFRKHDAGSQHSLYQPGPCLSRQEGPHGTWSSQTSAFQRASVTRARAQPG